MSEVKPFGVYYCGMQMVVAAIDALATLLIGREGYFRATGSTPPNEQPRKPVPRTWPTSE